MRINVHSNGGYGAGGFDRTGGEVNGPLQLNVAPVEPLHATNKQYVDNSITTHGQNTGLHLKVKDRELLDGLVVGTTEINRLNGVSSNVQDQLNSKLNLAGGTLTGTLTLSGNPTVALHAVPKQYVDSAVTTHSSDQALHLTAAQNTFLDAVTVTATEVNRLSGSTSNIQTQIDTKASLTGTETLTGKTLGDPISTGHIQDNGYVSSSLNAVTGLIIDCSTGNFFTKTIAANTAFTFSNAPASRAYAFTLELTITSGIPSWPASVVWPGNTAPALTTGKTHLLTFVTTNGGTRWRGVPNTNYTT